jgi:hypothetical protein
VREAGIDPIGHQSLDDRHGTAGQQAGGNPTEQLHADLKTCKRLLEDLRETESMLDAARAKPQGRLVVGILRTVLQHCLVPRLAEFCERHADGPADTSGMPDWFRSRYAGKLTERRG